MEWKIPGIVKIILENLAIKELNLSILTFYEGAKCSKQCASI
jgi:hypothetical protein